MVEQREQEVVVWDEQHAPGSQGVSLQTQNETLVDAVGIGWCSVDVDYCYRDFELRSGPECSLNIHDFNVAGYKFECVNLTAQQCPQTGTYHYPINLNGVEYRITGVYDRNDEFIRGCYMTVCNHGRLRLERSL